MKIKYFVFYLVVITLFGCNGSVHKTQIQNNKDTLNYTYKTIKQRAPDCGNKPDTDCTVVVIKYPDFTAQKTLNDTVTNELVQLFGLNDAKDTSANELAANFIKLYDKNEKSDKEKMPYTLNIAEKVMHQDSSLLSLIISGYVYDGGAHGGSQTIFLNWNTKKEKKILLDDIFVDGYKEPLNKAAEKIFRKDEKLQDTASLATNYFFKNNKFSLNENFIITPTGIRFLYNEYEIKSYAQGQTELFIPFALIKSLLRPNSVVSPYIK